MALSSTKLGPSSYEDLLPGRQVFGDTWLSSSPDVRENAQFQDLSPKPQGRGFGKPAWFDADKFAAGQRFFGSNFVGVLFAFFSALLVGLTVNSLADALVSTRVTDGASNSLKRYLDTLVHLMLWHEGDVFERDSVARKSLDLVARMHQHVRERMSRARMDGAAQMDLKMEDSPAEAGSQTRDDSQSDFNMKTRGESENYQYLSQHDMALVQSGFIGPVILHTDKLGIPASEEDLECYVHFWRTIGYCLGIADQYNVCANGVSQARRMCYDIEQRVIVPGLRNPSQQYLKLSGDFIDGVSQINPAIRRSVVEAYIYPDMGLEAPSLGLLDRLRLFIFWLSFLLSYYFRWYRHCTNQQARKYIEPLLRKTVARHPELR